MIDPIRQIADAVLYEGYLLWPYRRSATKNQKRWTFGGVYPPAHAAVHPDDRSELKAECLLEAQGEPEVDVRVRFLHVVRRSLRDRAGNVVGELEAAGERYLAWDEATEREVGVGEIDVPAGRAAEPLPDGAGEVVREWEAVRGNVALALEPVAENLFKVATRIENLTPWHGDDREDALRHTFCSTHAVLRTTGGEFVSPTDPPEQLVDAAAGCENSGLWPVLVGEPGRRDTVLASPIILSDYPEIASESPGDLFDATEIDQLLILNVLGLSDAEREEMRASDPRARAILERCASLTPEELMRLHGAIRDFRPAVHE